MVHKEIPLSSVQGTYMYGSVEETSCVDRQTKTINNRRHAQGVHSKRVVFETANMQARVKIQPQL